jgi:hypothetical protein
MRKTKEHKSKKSIMEELREIRDKISLETQDMTYEELRKYIDKRLSSPGSLYPKEVWDKPKSTKK